MGPCSVGRKALNKSLDSRLSVLAALYPSPPFHTVKGGLVWASPSCSRCCHSRRGCAGPGMWFGIDPGGSRAAVLPAAPLRCSPRWQVLSQPLPKPGEQQLLSCEPEPRPGGNSRVTGFQQHRHRGKELPYWVRFPAAGKEPDECSQTCVGKPKIRPAPAASSLGGAERLLRETKLKRSSQPS